MSATEGITKLTGPETWKVWNKRFINEASAKEIWDLIDPASKSKGQFQERPVKPEPADYPKLLIPPAAGTRASSETARATPLPEQVDPNGKPANVNEMTAAGKELYRQDVANYQFSWRQYKEERAQVSALTAWISKTVDDGIYNATCTPGKTLDVWYANLKERAGISELEDQRRTLERYFATVKPLARKPKDVLAWLATWEEALNEVIQADVPGLKSSSLWWPQFHMAIKSIGYDAWSTAYAVANEATINNNELTTQQVVKSFREQTREDDSLPRTIAKGAFATLDGQTPDQGDGSQRGPAQRTGKRKYTGGSKSGCPACDGRHTLEDCWSVLPEIRPANRKPAMAVEKRAHERMQQNPELRQRVEQLRKRVKKEDSVSTTSSGRIQRVEEID
ncbi:hypothetical protein VTI28DRAFT_2552 [Corynascus sepedonium]